MNMTSSFPHRDIVLRLCLAMFACIAGASICPVSATDLASMSPTDIRALQQRLTDAKCYSGPIDGTASPAVTAALNACPVMDPVLSIDTGMHTTKITRIGVDHDCKLLATGSDDKTTRLWSLPEGRLLRVLRVPVGPGDGGKIFSVAVSPDGKLAAVGGWDARSAQNNSHAVYLFDTASGEVKAVIGAFEDVIGHLTFSPDGRYLAALIIGAKGLRVIDVAQAKEIAADRDYKGTSFGAVFAPDGRLFTVADDGFLRSYDQTFRLIKRVRTKKRPYGVAVDPSGRLAAIGYYESPTVEIYRTSDLGFEFAAATAAFPPGSDLSSVAWSADGQRLVAGGTLTERNGGRLISIWDGAGRGRQHEQAVAHNRIMSILPCGDGFAFASADPVLGLLDANGNVTLSKGSVNADLRNMGDAFHVSSDGTNVWFSLEQSGKRPMLFDVPRGTLAPAGEQPRRKWFRVDGIDIRGWQGDTPPNLGGNPFALEPTETAFSLAIESDQSLYVVGTTYWLRASNAQGRPLWHTPVPATAWGMDLTGDGRLAVVAYGDGTIRWYRVSDGKELLALFINKDDHRWVAWTPSGYYAASPGGEDMIGWTLNRGWDQAADFFPASRFRERFSRPDIIQQVLLTLDEGKAIEVANKLANIRTDNSSVSGKLPPVVKILSPAEGAPVRDTDVTFEYELRSPSGQPVDSVEVLIDGRPSRGFKRVETKADGTRVEREIVNIPGRDVQIGLVAHAGSLTSAVSTVRLKWAGAAPSGDDLLKPKLFAVVVGVSVYRDSRLNLHYAAKDAHDFAEALKLQKGGLYRDVELKVLTDADATTGEVKRALSWLEASVTARDVGLVFLAGHGVTDARQRYYYLDYDSDPNHPEDTAVEDVVLKERTRSIAGKVLMFLDTCHAGQAMANRGATYINKLVEELSNSDNGVVTFASSTGRQLSLEDDDWQNGAFTKALIEGLPAPGRKGRADVTNKGVITTAALDLWLAERVGELTHGSQNPVMQRPIPDFALFTAEK
jgi:WD40 repeat protein